MANATDFIASVYDTLAKTFNFSDAPSSLVMQMAWPGIPISAADYKDATGKYDPNLAEEVFSALANIAPAYSKSKFEDSGFDIDDLYEIILASARPNGIPAADLPANPMFKLFADAQYEFVRSVKGSNSSPNDFYHPSVATPSNWYDESAAAFWVKVHIQSHEVKPVDNKSLFIKHNGMNLINKGIWKIKPKPVSDLELKNKLIQKNQTSKVVLTQQFNALKLPATANILSTNAQKINTGTKTKPTSSILLSSTFKNNFLLYNSKNLTQRLVPINSYDKNVKVLNSIGAQNINQSKLLVVPKTMPIKSALFLNNFLIKDLPTLPASPATNGYSISFGFCRVSIDRRWFNLALLNTSNWYVYGTAAREYSNGSMDNNPGMFPFLPTSFILINNLKITANWSADDKNAMSQAVSFGPFDIRNGTFNQNTLEVKGTQLIGCISKSMPALAPIDAPPI